MPLKRTLSWFQKAKPTFSTDSAMVQIGCHYEEVTESLDQLSGLDPASALLVINAAKATKALADDMKANPANYEVSQDSRVEFLDALCDQVVTGTGSAYMLNMDFMGAMKEVNDSNFSKFENGKPVFKENGKIGKGKDYVRPDLSPFV